MIFARINTKSGEIERIGSQFFFEGNIEREKMIVFCACVCVFCYFSNKA